MGTVESNQSFLQTIRNSIFALAIVLLPLTLSFAQDRRDLIQLPSLQSDSEKLAVLLQIKEKVPNLFSDALRYDIDLFALLEDEEKLLNQLKSNSNYLELFQHTKYHEIQMTPPQDGLQIGKLTIDPLAIQEWKEQLKNKLVHFKLKQEARTENTHPLEAIRSEIIAKVKTIDHEDSSLDGNNLLRDLGKMKVNQAVLNFALKESKARTLTERLSTALKIYDQLPEKPSHVSQKNLGQALELEQNREDLKSLIELHSALDRAEQNEDPSHHTWQTAEASLNALNSENLTTFQDKEDYLRPMVNRLIPSSSPQLQEDLLNRIHKNISTFSSRTINSEKKAITPLTISQQHPIIGIFRGCAGGDCSSRLSFPYPNDPNEKVFFILDKNRNVKGYVSATQVIANHKPSLYVITVSGNRVTSADTELILRGLEKEKANLGVEQILLPTPDKLGNLMNFPAPRSVYQRYTVNQPTVAIQYNHPEIRSGIQSYRSTRGYNLGLYDHMDQNSQAVVLSFKENSGNEKMITQIHELPTTSLPTPPLNSIPMREVFEFLLDLKRSGRQKIENKILQIDYVKQSLSPKKYQKLTQLLSGEQSEVTVQEFKNLLKHHLSELDRSLSDYLDKNPSLAYPAILSCTDAFSAQNRDETAKYIIKHLKDSSERLPFNDQIWTTQIENHLTELNNIERFRRFKEDLLRHLEDQNPNNRKNALYCLGKIKPLEPAVHLKILQAALQDSDFSVKVHAFNALKRMNLKDPSIHLKISQALQDPDVLVRLIALETLAALKPTDPTTHHHISQAALEDRDKRVRLKALSVLEAIKPDNPHIHSKILKVALQDQDADQEERIKALSALQGIKSKDPSILSKILGIALQDSDERMRSLAFSILAVAQLSDSTIPLQILKTALQDPSNQIRMNALLLLERLSSAHPEVSRELLRIAIHHGDSSEKAIALQVLFQVVKGKAFSNPSIRQALQAEVNKNLEKLQNRADLFDLIADIIYPALAPGMRNQNYCESVQNLLGSERNLKSLIQFFSAHSKILEVSQPSPEGIDVKEHLSSTDEE